MTQTEFRNVIVCEDVREEAGNKKSLMGLLSGDIMVAQFPAQIRLAFYVEYLPPKDVTETELEFIIAIGKDAPITGKITIGPVQDVATIVFPSAIAKFKEPGEITLYAKRGSDVIELIRKAVRLPRAHEMLQFTPPTASPPPS